MVSFDDAVPSFTHMAIASFQHIGKSVFIVTQNVDNLHRKSGIKSESLAELHGNLNLEKCENCSKVYEREFDVGTISFKPTGRNCSHCGGCLRDTLLDWHDALPDEEWNKAKFACENADLVVCIGTSLRVNPANSLPTLGINNVNNEKCKLVIINLQKTPKDEKAHLLIRAKCDDVMRQVVKMLQMKIPIFRRTDKLTFELTDFCQNHQKEAKTQHECTISLYSCSDVAKRTPTFISKVELQQLNEQFDEANFNPNNILLCYPFQARLYFRNTLKLIASLHFDHPNFTVKGPFVKEIVVNLVSIQRNECKIEFEIETANIDYNLEVENSLKFEPFELFPISQPRVRRKECFQ